VIKPAYSPRYARTVSSDLFAKDSMKLDEAQCVRGQVTLVRVSTSGWESVLHRELSGRDCFRSELDEKYTKEYFA